MTNTTTTNNNILSILKTNLSREEEIALVRAKAETIHLKEDCIRYTKIANTPSDNEKMALAYILFLSEMNKMKEDFEHNRNATFCLKRKCDNPMKKMSNVRNLLAMLEERMNAYMKNNFADRKTNFLFLYATFLTLLDTLKDTAYEKNTMYYKELFYNVFFVM